MTTTNQELQRQSIQLLRKLKVKQAHLQGLVEQDNKDGYVSDNNKHTTTQPSDVRDKKQALTQGVSQNNSKNLKNFENSQTKVLGNDVRVEIQAGQSTTFNARQQLKCRQNKSNVAANQPQYTTKKPSYVRVTNTNTSNQEEASIAQLTPKKIKRRRIIDRNVHVESTLNESTDLDDLDDSSIRLNFSYSNEGDEQDDDKLQSRFNDSPPDYLQDEGNRKRPTSKKDYVVHLQDAGNSKEMAKFVKEVNKPKSILSSTDKKKASNKVTFKGHKSPSTSQKIPTNNALLGYDWIASLLDNDKMQVERSEEFFEELRDFRKVNTEECINTAYMDAPLILSSERKQAANPSAEVFNDKQIRPYTVNDRLFTTPIESSLPAQFDEYDEDGNKIEPTEEAPRFIRVSIPRSTLVSPHKMASQSHRRRSFDATDTFSLGKHCVKGWESSRPAVMPTASNVGLRQASIGLKSENMTTTKEAEKVVTSFFRGQIEPRVTAPVPAHLKADQILQLRNKSLLDRSQNLNQTLNRTGMSQEEQADFSRVTKETTDSLLDTTYSLMYEMQRMKNERNK